MVNAYENSRAAVRPADPRADPEVERAYERRIDCCDSPRTRERSGGGRGAGARDAEAHGVRTRGHDVH